MSARDAVTTTDELPDPGARPYVVDIKRNSLDDGPGIRSVVFFKGCPLRCVWCQNPEAIRPLPEVQRSPQSCIGCRACEAVCPVGRARPATEPEPSSIACTLCEACVRACPASARRMAGKDVALDDLVSRLLRDAAFYRRSGGGVTLSGGEPALFARFAGELAAALRARGVHVLMETCGFFRWDEAERHLVPHLSTVYFDLKIADPERHRRFVGRDNTPIHDNLRRLVRRDGLEILPRIPLIPSITDDDDNLRALARLVREVGLTRVALLPYNPLWIHKRRALGLDLPYAHAGWMSAEAVERCRAVVAESGLTIAP